MFGPTISHHSRSQLHHIHIVPLSIEPKLFLNCDVHAQLVDISFYPYPTIPPKASHSSPPSSPDVLNLIMANVKSRFQQTGRGRLYTSIGTNITSSCFLPSLPIVDSGAELLVEFTCPQFHNTLLLKTPRDLIGGCACCVCPCVY